MLIDNYNYNLNKFLILFDNREKKMWNFDLYDCCLGQKGVTLTTGDYTIDGLEDILTIERKRTTAEIAINLGSKHVQFRKELERMTHFRFSYIICEFTEEDILKFPIGSGIPKRMWKKLRVSGKFLLSRLYEWSEMYEVELHMCNDRVEAEIKAIDIMKTIYKVVKEEELNEKTDT